MSLAAAILVWLGLVLAALAGAWWGVSAGRRSALEAAADAVREEACWAVLHSDQAAGRLFRLADALVGRVPPADAAERVP